MIKTSDKVKIISGKDKGKTGKVLKVFPAAGRVLVEGVNIRKKHTKPRKAGEKGQIIEMAFPVDISNAMAICLSCSKPTRIGKKVLAKGKKTRNCRKCGAEV
jgi:large subunit ribosomal protein L24